MYFFFKLVFFIKIYLYVILLLGLCVWYNNIRLSSVRYSDMIKINFLFIWCNLFLILLGFFVKSKLFLYV